MDNNVTATYWYCGGKNGSRGQRDAFRHLRYPVTLTVDGN